MSKIHIGQCIYCRTLPTPSDPLQDEHIFPFGLFGKRMLGKASCKSCANKTSDFEGKVQKEDLRALRTVLQFPTRRKRKRKNVTTLPIQIVTRSGEAKRINIPIEDYFAVLALPVFKLPAHISKEEYKEGIDMVGVVTVDPKRSIDEIANKYDAEQISVELGFYPEAWALMFAKIAYALAVEHYGLERMAVENTYVSKAILGETNDIGMWVGCDNQKVFNENNPNGSEAAGVWQIGNEIHARIKLFEWLDVPEYLVIVGQLF